MRKNIPNIIGLSCLAIFMSVFTIILAEEDEGERKRDQPRRPEATEERR